MNRRPERLADLLPAVVADLAARHTTNGAPMTERKPCVFCEIVAFKAPADRIHDTPDTTAFVPLNPVNPGHVLIVPTVHVKDAAEDPEVTARTMADAARLAGLYGVPFNLITSAGADATQTVFHLHVHYVPRRAGDGLTLPWTGQERAA